MQAENEGRLRYSLRRLAVFLRLMAKSRMAAIGLIILIVSAFLAVTAPVFFPGAPASKVVGAPFAQPEWVTIFPEGYHLSKNIVVVNDPLFKSPSALQEWSYQKPVSIALAWSTTAPSPGQGSLQITSTSNSITDVAVTKSFNYPYRGPPGRLEDLPNAFAVKADGISSAQPVFVQFFIDTGTHKYVLWSANITQGGSWNGPPYGIDSLSEDFRSNLGFTKGITGLSTNEAIFSTVGQYSYGFAATFYGPGKLYVTNVGLTLFGTAYGVLGTDAFGADLLGQNVYGSRISLFVGLLSAFIGISLGLIIGLVAGYKTGLTDEVLMRFTDMMLVIPFLPLLIVLIAVLGASITNLIIVIGFLGWMGFARVIRSQVLSIKERPYIEAARASGAGSYQILSKHVFPNIVSLTYVNLALTVPGAILAEAALSFLGLGDPTAISWGQILNRAQETFALRYWWITVPPGLAIAIVSLSFILLGYALDEIFNPKLRMRR